jgi:serine/threonine protein kinase
MSFRVGHIELAHLVSWAKAEHHTSEEVSCEYLVMEYIPGSTLRDTMPEDGFHPDDNAMGNWLTQYFLPVLEGVQAMHELGIVHRDLQFHERLRK